MNVIDVNIEHDHIINEWNSFTRISIHDFVVHFYFTHNSLVIHL
jgi:hypothetical protein